MATYNDVKNNSNQNSTERTTTQPKMVGSLDENATLSWEPIEFKSIGQTTRIRSDELARKIRAAFAETFHDLKGCFIGYDTVRNTFEVDLFFELNTEPVPDNKIKNLINLTAPVISSNNKFDLYYKNQVVQNKIIGKSFTINDETKLLLSDFMFGGRNANKPNNKNWNKYISEVPIPISAYGDPFFRTRNADRIMIKVTGLDIRRVLNKLYGNKMVVSTTIQGESAVSSVATAYYEPRVVYSRNNTPAAFTINIERFDKEAVQKITLAENPQAPLPGVLFY